MRDKIKILKPVMSDMSMSCLIYVEVCGSKVMSMSSDFCPSGFVSSIFLLFKKKKYQNKKACPQCKSSGSHVANE